MSSAVAATVQLGFDNLAHKYYSLATGTILFYDYFLTLPDEVQYAWSGKKSAIFWLFIFNRYFPMTWQIWVIGVAYVPESRLGTLGTFAQCMGAMPTVSQICDKTSWYSLILFVGCTLLAQIVLTIRLHAVTMKNTLITSGFAFLTVAQLGLGLCMIVIAVRLGVQSQPHIPLDAYHICVFALPPVFEVAYASLTLCYDFLAFAFIMFFTRKARVPGLKFRTIWDTIAEDATKYFLVIFTNHVVWVFTLNLGRKTIKSLPGPGLTVFLPLMISRIILSMRKAADTSRFTTGLSTTDTNPRGIHFFDTTLNITTGRGGDIPLETYQVVDGHSAKTSC